jgi:hypothetical protein
MHDIQIKILKCFTTSLALSNNVDFLMTAEVVFSSTPTYKIICQNIKILNVFVLVGVIKIMLFF